MFRLRGFVNSSLWITVLVVRVGCIIEAHPSPNNNGEEHKLSHRESAQQQHNDDHALELETAASHSFISSPINGLEDGGRSGSISKKQRTTASLYHIESDLRKAAQQPPVGAEARAVLLSPRKSLGETISATSTTTRATSPEKAGTRNKQEQQQHLSEGISRGENDNDRSSNENENDDTCAGKADGYYQNLGSGCTSYYFCAAGYQATYICPIGSKFNGKRCENEYVCPTTTSDGHRISNDCENKSNGYYPANGRVNAGKYFYCFQKAKVIELQCDSGKIFVKDKCVLASSSPSDSYTLSRNHGMSQGEAESAAVREMSKEGNSREATAATADALCSRKPNGFYQDLESNCKKYYYCIGGDKTELSCQDEYIFNGDICVHESRYECPHAFLNGQNGSQQSELRAGRSGSIDQRIVTDAESGRTDGELTTRNRNARASKSSSTNNSNAGVGRGIATEAGGKLPIISVEVSSLENDYYSSRDDSDRRAGTTTTNPSHLNVS